MKLAAILLGQELLEQCRFFAHQGEPPEDGMLDHLVDASSFQPTFGYGILLTFDDGSQYSLVVRTVQEAEV